METLDFTTSGKQSCRQVLKRSDVIGLNIFITQLWLLRIDCKATRTEEGEQSGAYYSKGVTYDGGLG